MKKIVEIFLCESIAQLTANQKRNRIGSNFMCKAVYHVRIDVMALPSKNMGQKI